eukprot:13669163-Ditylum_brightwellii.AAC.1
MSTHPEITMATHQCAQFCNNPKLSHERAVRQIMKYLSVTSDRGFIYKTDPSLGIQCYVDADFASGWNKADAENPENFMLQTGFTIMYAGCTTLWQSRPQTKVVLSTAEA